MYYILFYRKIINEAYYIEKFLIMPTDEFIETINYLFVSLVSLYMYIITFRFDIKYAIFTNSIM